VLLDVDDVAFGHKTKLRWNDKADWIWSAELKHEALVSAEDFARVQEQMSAGRNRPTVKQARGSSRAYALRGLLTCGLCGRRMAGQHNHGRAHYRCRYPTEYALANEVEHPRTVYLREDEVIPALDAWLARIFDPENLDETCAALAAASGTDDADEAALEGARRKLLDCDDRLGRYRAALEGGADPKVVAGWIAEVQGERLRAEQALALARRNSLRSEEVRAVLSELPDVREVLASADPALKGEVYADLGIRLTYKPAERIVAVEATPTRVPQCVSEGGLPRAHPGL
jgi:site-specific DNA recombinase